MAQSLKIKDGDGLTTSLQVESGSAGLISTHVVSSSVESPVFITGSVRAFDASANNVTITTYYYYGTGVSESGSIKLYGDYLDASGSSGSVKIGLDQNRRGLIVNYGGPLGNNTTALTMSAFVRVGASTSAPYGFVFNQPFTASNGPSSGYSFVLNLGGTYFADGVSSGLSHAFYIPSASSGQSASLMPVLNVTEIF